MSISFELTAERRDDMGKGASRRLRREGKVPAIMYGAHKDPQPIALLQNDLVHNLEHEAFYSHILTINIGGSKEQAVLKDLQRHPYKPVILHVDLQRISAHEKLRMHVPLHFKGEEVAPGVKAGGMITHLVSDVEVSCLPKDLPEFIEADISRLGLDETLHMSDLKTGSGVTLIELSHGHDQPVASIHLPRVSAADEEQPVAAEGEAGGEAASEGGAEAAGEAEGE
ncbi:MAG: 50S ribosomal protein L25/general stress protein Ctc [Gammaproteobacteria bacterium]|nr:50S ribosomal protein L25/general stress protein Ctc [Gammaproteobacteria bacterium]